MNKKGNPKYISYLQVYDQIYKIFEENSFDIQIPFKLKSYLESIKGFPYLEHDDLEHDVLVEIIKRNKKEKTKLLNREFLCTIFDKSNVDAAYWFVGKKDKIIKADSSKESEFWSGYFVHRIADAYNCRARQEHKQYSLPVIFKEYPHLKKIHHLLSKNYELIKAIRTLVEYEQEEKLFEWFSEGLIDKSKLGMFVDTFFTPTENIEKIMNRGKFPKSSSTSIGKIVRDMYK